MKALIALVGFVLFGQVALAGQNVFTYRTLLVEQSHTGRMCPELVTTTAVNELNSLRGRAVHIVDSRGVSAVYTYQNTTRKCKEGVRCDSSNHYSQKSSAEVVSLRLKNDYAFPTTDLPGYAELTISWLDQQTSVKRFCSYMLL